MNLRYLIIVIIVLYCISCKKNTSPISPENIYTEIVPLKIGNTWLYEFTVYDSLMNATSSSQLEATICCDTLVNEIYYYTFDKESDLWYFNNNSGLWTIRNSVLNDFTAPSLHYKYPCKVGDKYSYFFEVASVDTSILVPAGKFKCIFYYSDIVEYFVSPGIGTIKSSSYIKNDRNEYYELLRYELIDYSIQWLLANKKCV